MTLPLVNLKAFIKVTKIPISFEFAQYQIEPFKRLNWFEE